MNPKEFYSEYQATLGGNARQNQKKIAMPFPELPVSAWFGG